MALTDSFREAVLSGDVVSVRIMMEDSLLADRTFATFNEMEKAAASMEGLYDEHDGEELVEDHSLWNDDYMNSQMVKVLSNFSHERLDHLKQVVRYLRPADEKPKSSGDDTVAKIGVGAGIGALAGGAIALAAGISTLGVVGSTAVGAVIGGVIATIAVNGGNK